MDALINDYFAISDLRRRQLGSITIRNLDEPLKKLLRIQAARHGRSMEDEARDILRCALNVQKVPRNLADSIRARVAEFGGFDIPHIPREPPREPPNFEE